MYYKRWTAEINPYGLYYVRKTYIIESEKRWVTIDGRHVNIGGDDGGGSSGSSGGTIFHSRADPMAEVTGDAEKSNPKEIKAYKKELQDLGVELIRRKEETLALFTIFKNWTAGQSIHFRGRKL